MQSVTHPGRTRTAPPPTVDEGCRQACLAGDRAAIERVFRTYGPTVNGLLGRLVGPTVDLEDLVQTTFLEALANLRRFRGEASLSTWICGIAVHVAQHHLRAGKVRRHVPLELVAEDEPPLVAPNTNAEGEVDDRRLATRLHALLDRIHAKKRVALLLYVVEGYSVEEVAALMNATRTATRSRMFFARRELRALIAKDAVLAQWAAERVQGDLGGDS